MTLDEAMKYRGENPATLSDALGIRETTLKNYTTRTGILCASVKKLRLLAEKMDAGFLITEDGVEVELYGNGGKA